MAFPESCPLCKAGDAKQRVVTPHVYGDRSRTKAFFHCAECDVRYLYPSLSEKEEAEFYAAEFESFMAERSGASGGWAGAERHIRANQETVKRRLKYLAPQIQVKTSVLEIGCSSGFMLYPLIEKGCNCEGVEPSGVFRDYVQGRGIEVYGSIKELKKRLPGKSFDLIMHFFVLEHISDPKNFLEEQLSLLNPDGKIIFEIPNVADPLVSVYDIPEFERFYWSIAHHWYFSEASLRYLLESIDRPYQILHDQRYDLSNHMVWARDRRPGGLGRFTSLLGLEIEESYKKALIKNRTCDTLIGIIHKSSG